MDHDDPFPYWKTGEEHDPCRAEPRREPRITRFLLVFPAKAGVQRLQVLEKLAQLEAPLWTKRRSAARERREVIQTDLAQAPGFNDRQILSDIELGKRQVAPANLASVLQQKLDT